MDYLLIFVLFLMIQNDAQGKTSEPRRITNNDDSFDVNIGAGYGVGPDQPSDSLPRSTTKIVRARDYPSNGQSQSIVRFVREPRILTNFTPVNTGNIKSEAKSQNRIYDFTNFDSPPSSDFENNHLNSYQVHESFSDSEKHSSSRPSLMQLQKVINGDKSNSKIVEVIKVPAVYEIHVQTDNEKSNHVNENSGLKEYGKHKPIFRGFSTQFSDDYIKWLKSYYKKKEEDYLKESEKFKEQHFPTVPNIHESLGDTLPEWNNEHLQQDEVLDPVLAHHYKHIGSFENKRDSKLRYAPWQEAKRPYDKDILYGTQSLKRDAGLSKYKSNPAPFKSEFSQTKKSLDPYKIDNKLDTVGKYTNFRRNQEISEFNQPQALHEVPAPYLGKYPRPKGIEQNTLTKSDEFTPRQKQDQIQFGSIRALPTSPQFERNKILDSSYNQVKAEEMPFKAHSPMQSEVVPSTRDFISSLKGTQNFIYGKRMESVLTPKEIDPTENITTQHSSAHPDNYHRSDYNRGFSENAIKISNSDTNEEKQCTDCEKNVQYQLSTPNPDMNILGLNNSSQFNKKSDTIYNYQKKDLIFDSVESNNMDFSDVSKPMTPVYKNSFYSIYPKKVFNGKKNLLRNTYSTDFKKDGIYPLTENRFQSFKSKNQSKPLGYVIYITKKSTDDK